MRLSRDQIEANLKQETNRIQAEGMDATIQRLVNEGALFVSNHSGGKDSQVMLIKLLELVPKHQLIVIHASLGKMEWPGALEHAEKQATEAQLPFIVATASKTLFEMVERRYKARPEVPSWPSSATRQCTSDLKRGPIQKEVRQYAKQNGFTKIVNCLGLRAKESTGRAKKKPLTLNVKASTNVATWYEWLPVHELTKYEVFAEIARSGQKPHFAYTIGNDRLSCIFCLFGSENDIKNGARHHPKLLSEYDSLEKKTGYTMHMSRIPLVEIAS
ncbi:phosphoadenosine phosphosulfate reductase family protein [Hahella ganghwensis]|uniref:phosphoadenosine phosphosulfate reductase domain-containing protein n=1 Tax=Hahella ganghwensis TaxID=286420 RepID=UPI00036C7BF9|nr:phosphoadenosine phosphosulfate reductase family protein [Hahella ganghwensis]